MSDKPVLRIVLACCAAAFVTLLFWAGGFDFTERGAAMTAWIGCSAYAGFAAWIVYGVR